MVVEYCLLAQLEIVGVTVKPSALRIDVALCAGPGHAVRELCQWAERTPVTSLRALPQGCVGSPPSCCTNTPEVTPYRMRKRHKNVGYCPISMQI